MFKILSFFFLLPFWADGLLAAETGAEPKLNRDSAGTIFNGLLYNFNTWKKITEYREIAAWAGNIYQRSYNCEIYDERSQAIGNVELYFREIIPSVYSINFAPSGIFTFNFNKQLEALFPQRTINFPLGQFQTDSYDLRKKGDALLLKIHNDDHIQALGYCQL